MRAVTASAKRYLLMQAILKDLLVAPNISMASYPRQGVFVVHEKASYICATNSCKTPRDFWIESDSMASPIALVALGGCISHDVARLVCEHAGEEVITGRLMPHAVRSIIDE
jgi:hypothetical protein